MTTYGIKATVSSQEAEALKEMIFKRARERAQALVEESQGSLTRSVQTDVMDLARDSFVSSKNPFAVDKVDPVDIKETSRDEEIGFAKRQVSEIKSHIALKNNIVNTDIKNREVELTMNEARENLAKKPSFIGALDFLNSQATIALVQNKGQKFEALA